VRLVLVAVSGPPKIGMRPLSRFRSLAETLKSLQKISSACIGVVIRICVYLLKCCVSISDGKLSYGLALPPSRLGRFKLNC
jgi:hypothetical protein